MTVPETEKVNNEIPLFLFHQGTNFTSYELLGCHFDYDERSGVYNYVFRVWAPNADYVSVVGDLTGWDEGIKMERISTGVWEGSFSSPTNYENTFYKYANVEKDRVGDQGYKQTELFGRSVVKTQKKVPHRNH